MYVLTRAHVLRTEHTGTFLKRGSSLPAPEWKLHTLLEGLDYLISFYLLLPADRSMKKVNITYPFVSRRQAIPSAVVVSRTGIMKLLHADSAM